jgi:hypothetical protein
MLVLVMAKEEVLGVRRTGTGGVRDVPRAEHASRAPTTASTTVRWTTTP